ncbi:MULTISPECIES: hypothetical protein [Paenibacillus]|uniref:Uncharacterized protein n=1 Tax=Paenibacillus odorifer TaxID=189426 RepID=A0A1R0X4M5_9BACL|nr:MULTISPECIES: hypothetical protein [Paenibacillus]AIQ34116.1 hypothetical protein R50345_05345 [Paenibacillus sp. FSL R5-0345]ETT61998.1 hypothetical protein C171_11034 [Paenibacillus sp. FSL H8-237]OMD28946.1 hypothetical protein BJP51_23470 [Paenibacillus odorifer]OME22911.1 hypothetical protein BSK57_16950 [Paenibacillus odorifer]OME30394.1 hypothetical protein BSK63_17860 [Paenibacillus odorifer]
MMNSSIQQVYKDVIEKQWKDFDKQWLALKTRRGPAYNYHTNVRDAEVHLIRESFYFSLSLLDRQDEGDAELAAQMIGCLLDFQELDREHPYYGIWPYYMEESVADMASPDRNWADFCGKALIQAYVDHGDKLPAELQGRIKNSLEAAAELIKERNVLPSYTNICIMGTYVALLAGELLDNKDLFTYGRSKLKLLHEYCTLHGAFTEYNSPTYTIVAIEDLSLMLRHIRDTASLEMIRELHDMAWASIAEHYHSTTGQWAGPHSRSYETLQGKGLLSFLQLAGQGRLHFLDEDELEISALWVRVGLNMPEQYVSYFKESRAASYSEKVIVKGAIPVVASSYLTPELALGSFNHCDLWNQRRPLTAYWGERGHASSLRFRCLHDQYDFSSGLLHTVQHRGMLLGIAHFCADHGDKHFVLDPIHGVVKATSLLFRFEFGGERSQLVMPEQIEAGKPLLIRSPYVTIGLVFEDYRFGAYIPQLRVIEEETTTSLEIILYEGAIKELKLTELKEAHLAFGLVVENANGSEEEILAKLAGISTVNKEGQLQLAYEDPCKKLELQVPTGVLPFRQTMEQAAGRIEIKLEAGAPIWSV